MTEEQLEEGNWLKNEIEISENQLKNIDDLLKLGDQSAFTIGVAFNNLLSKGSALQYVSADLTRYVDIKKFLMTTRPTVVEYVNKLKKQLDDL